MIDRVTRDRMAEAIAAYMRGEIKAREFEKQTLLGSDVKDEALEHVSYKLWLTYDDFIDHPIHATVRRSNELLRWMAFLKTDYRLKEWRPPWSQYPRFLPQVFLLLLCLSLAVSWLAGRWLILAWAWLSLAVTWAVLTKRKQDHDVSGVMSDPEFVRLREFEPFLSTEDWQRHAHLLEGVAVPEYDSTVHDQQFRSDDRRLLCRLREWLGRTLGALLVLPLWLLCECRASTSDPSLCLYLRADEHQSDQCFLQ